MLNILIIISGVLLIVSKFTDCWTTTIGIKKSGVENEKNPIAKKLMKKFGYMFVIWGVFTFTIIISVILVFSTINSENYLYKIAFILLALFISSIQFYAGYRNNRGI